MKKKDMSPDDKLIEEIESDAYKKIKSLKEGDEIMFGLGTFGIVGWSVAVPVLLGVASGLYLDKKYSQSFSWTLTLIFAGIIIGCINSWLWIKKSGSGE